MSTTDTTPAAAAVPRLLLRYMADHQVVPVVGQSLSLVEGDKGQPARTVHKVLAERLAERLCVPVNRLPPGFGLNDVVCGYPDFHSVPSSIYAELRDLYEEQDFAVPEALRKLARIPAFDLYVTTSFDGLLKRALEEERGGVDVLTYFPKSKVDLDLAPRRGGRPVLFELFGHISTALDEYTLSEDDLLEFSRSLQTEPNRPGRLLSILGRSHLLFLGNEFPDWLARFFIRTIKDNRIRSQRGRQEFIVDRTVLEDPALLEFIRYFSRETTVLPAGDVAAFVEELERAWFELRPESAASAAEAEDPSPGREPDGDGASLFISYASEDRAAALRVKEALADLGWRVWLDQDGGLAAGDDYERKIRRQILDCSVFLPLISRHTEETLPGRGRFFRREWNWALERLPDFTGTDWEFIVPVPLDAVDARTAQVPEAFRARHWIEPAREGELPPSFLHLMKMKLRHLRRH